MGRSVPGSQAEAIRAVVDGAANQHPQALFILAGWHLAGTPVPRDLPRARRLLREAAAAGYPDAAMLDVILTGNGTGAPADWSGARQLLEQAGERYKGPFSDQCALLRRIEERAGERCTHESLAAAPSIKLFKGFFNAEECHHIMAASRDYLEPALVQDPVSGRMIPHPIRTSCAAILGPTRATLPIQALGRRIAEASSTVPEQAESMTVLRYAGGQEFKAHYDTLAQTRNQRCATALVYLNSSYTGGETVFPKLGLTVRGQLGDMLLFNNVTDTGDVEPRSLHAGLPVTRGEKWLASIWIRQRPFNVWNGPERS